MQIQCPHCKSKYRLGDDMVDAYGGFVRCGNCNYKFNIHDQISMQNTDADLINTSIRPSLDKGTHDLQRKEGRIEPRLERNKEEDELNILFRPDGEKVEPVENETLEDSDANEPKLNGVESTDDDADPLANFSFPDQLDELDIEQDSEFSEDLDELAEEMLEEETDIELDLEDQVPFEEESEPFIFHSLDDFDEDQGSGPTFLSEHEEEEVVVEPGFVQRLFSGVWKSTVFLFWAASAVALAYLLFGQIKNTLYPAYRNHPLVQKARVIACEYLPCYEADYDPEQLEIVVSRMDEVKTDPRELDVSIFLLNRGETAQAYPNILLSLKTIDGTTVGQRVIYPEEYFTANDSLLNTQAGSQAKQTARIKPDKLGKILIKLNNPPQQAVGFEAKVVP